MSAKKTKKKSNKKKSTRTKSPAKAAKKTVAKKKVATRKKAAGSTKKRPAPAKKTSARSAPRKKQPPVNPEREIKQEFGKNLTSAASGRQAGDLQGLSRTARADSESVDELVEEGNLFEAGAVAGVQEADDSDEKEVHTHEVPEDDVPEEYLDEQ